MRTASIVTILIVFLFSSVGFAEERPWSDIPSAATCTSILDGYLAERIGEDVVKGHRSNVLKSMFEKCDYFVSSEIPLSDDDVEQVSNPRINFSVNKDLIDTELVKLGLLVNGNHSVVVFASERIEKNWFGSFFTGLKKNGKISLNECETVLREALLKKGFSDGPHVLDHNQMLRARKFKTVINRYKDLSAMPNFTSVRAAAIVDETASAVLGCMVVVKVKERKGDVPEFNACAKARCKTVDIGSLKGVATAASSSCESNKDKTTASIAAIRETCRDLGNRLASNLVKHYSHEGEVRR